MPGLRVGHGGSVPLFHGVYPQDPFNGPPPLTTQSSAMGDNNQLLIAALRFPWTIQAFKDGSRSLARSDHVLPSASPRRQ